MEKIYEQAESSWIHRLDVTFRENEHLIHIIMAKWRKFFRQKRESKNIIFSNLYRTVSQKVEMFDVRPIWPIIVFINTLRIIQSLRVPILSKIWAELQYLETTKVQDVLANHPGFRQRMYGYFKSTHSELRHWRFILHLRCDSQENSFL